MLRPQVAEALARARKESRIGISSRPMIDCGSAKVKIDRSVQDSWLEALTFGLD